MLLISPMEPALNSQIIPSQLITHPRSRLCPKPCPKPRPIFGESPGKKRKIVDLSRISSDSNPQASLQASGENKRHQNSQGRNLSNSNPIAAPVEDIRQALIAQREPQPAAISSLRTCTLTSI